MGDDELTLTGDAAKFMITDVDLRRLPVGNPGDPRTYPKVIAFDVECTGCGEKWRCSEYGRGAFHMYTSGMKVTCPTCGESAKLDTLMLMRFCDSPRSQ